MIIRDEEIFFREDTIMIGEWLLCDFHIHTTNSDGYLPLREIIDIYGKQSFDVISITDHVLDSKTIEKAVKSAIRNYRRVAIHLYRKEKPINGF